MGSFCHSVFLDYLQETFQVAPHCVKQMERVLLIGVRLFRDGEGKVSPNSYASEDEMTSNHANRDRSTCQFCEQTFQVASTTMLVRLKIV